MKKTKEASPKHAPIPVDPTLPVEPRPRPCDAIRTELEAWLSGQKDLKEFQLESCDKEGHDEADCPCSGGSSNRPPIVDLIVLIDTSGSMGTTAQAVSNAAKSAIEQAKKECPSDLRVTWLGVDGTNAGTTDMSTWATWGNFNQSHEAYLVGLHGAGIVPSLAGEALPHAITSEQGANAIEDLSRLFDWRKGACRAIFYISDTTLDSDGSQTSDDTNAVNSAVAAANANDVTVFAHFVEPHQIYPPADEPSAIASYQFLCTQTGGNAVTDGTANVDTYMSLLKDVICKACVEKCKTVEFPDIQPCISVAWGDGDCDCLETDDYEVLYVTVCNCFTNVTFANFSIAQLTVTNADGTPVAILPDGTDSVEVRPRGPICFGNIGPCVDGKPNCKSREFVLYTRGAKQGKYNLKFKGICFDISYSASTERCFEFDLCYS